MISLLEIHRSLPPPEAVRPDTIGRQLFRAFEGSYPEGQPFSPQLSFLVNHDLVFSPQYGYPDWQLSRSGSGEISWQSGAHFGHDVATTEKPTAHSLHLLPQTVEYASTVLTVTYGHHQKTGITQSLLAVQTLSGRIDSFLYNKTKDINDPDDLPNPLTDLRSMNRLMQEVPEERLSGALIQVWNLDEHTYRLQANLALMRIPLYTFLHVMAATPYMIENLEAKFSPPGSHLSR